MPPQTIVEPLSPSPSQPDNNSSVNGFLKKTVKRRPLETSSWDSDSVTPLLRRILSARGVCKKEDCDISLKKLLPPGQLKGCHEAAVLLANALAAEKRILFVGDFDADGATSTAVGVQALKSLGAGSVEYLVPNRFDFGYGLTPEIVDVAKDFQPDVLITVDNGISSLEGVNAARALGWQVIITDHHLPGESLPAADVIVNPSQPGCDFPSKAIAGVGVIFYVMMALRAELRKRDWFKARRLSEPNLGELLDLVALGTVADVVPLDRNNRILVEQGLRRIRSGCCRPGVEALLEKAGRQAHRLVTADLGYAVGPRLNAAGRLEDMSLGINCLLSETIDIARSMAEELDALNQERKSIEREMQEQASVVLQQLYYSGRDLPPALCLYDENWHQGVIGILASRVKERYHRPVIAFAKTGENEIKGSARSVPGLHIRDCLDAVAKKHPQLLTKFGGHAMAAGLSLDADLLEDFQKVFQEQVSELLAPEDLQAEILTDGELMPEEMSLGSAESLRNAAPWGQGFPEPCFDGLFQVVSARIVGERHAKLTLSDPRNGELYDAIQFNVDLNQDMDNWRKVRSVFRLDVNEYMGNRNLQLLIEYIEPL